MPALQAIGDHFPESKLSILVGSACADLVRLTGIFDDVIVVNRRELRRMNKVRAVGKLVGMAREVRRRRFDLVIDLHSLPETNILAYLSGAPRRLLGNRESRSIDILSNYRPSPPLEDKSVHISRYYLNVLSPLGISVAQPRIKLIPGTEDRVFVNETLGLGDAIPERLVGICPGAGHESRRWPLENFGSVASSVSDDSTSVVVFLGPEESARPEFKQAFGEGVRIVSGLSIPQLVAAFSMLSVLVGNDSGPVHIAAATGVPVVLLQHELSPPRFLPLTDKLKVLQKDTIAAISPSEVVHAVREFLGENTWNANGLATTEGTAP